MNDLTQNDQVLKRVELHDGVALHFIENGRGQPVLLLHGGMGDCHAWASQMCVFAESFRVIAYSRRHSSPNRNRDTGAGHSVHVDADDLMAFELLLRFGPAHLVGTSYGALVALVFALEHPGKVLSLVLAEPPLHCWACRTPAGATLFDAFIVDTWRPAAEAFDNGDDRRALQLLTNGIWGEPVFESLSAERRAAMLRNAESMKALTRSADPFPDLVRAKVAALGIPTLLVRGGRASALHACVMDELADVMAHARTAVIDGAGHGSPCENSRGFNDAVLGFLAEQDRHWARSTPHRC